MNKQDNFIKGRIKSFGYAFKGLAHLISSQPNSWIHITLTVLVIIFGLVLRISNIEWLLLVLCIGFVLSAELFNTALEYLLDLIHPDYAVKAGRVKDLSAAAVLIMAISSAVVGFIIFIPKITLLLLNTLSK